MTKKNLFKTIATALTMVTLTGSLLACSGGGDDENKATKEAATTKKVEATTEKPTEEPTTEAPTEHVYKGLKYTYLSGSNFGKYFANKTLNPGDKIVINDIYDDTLTPIERGKKVESLITILYSTFYPEKSEEFFNEHFVPGAAGYEFTYEENFVIEYGGDKPIFFELAGEKDNVGYLDIYLLD